MGDRSTTGSRQRYMGKLCLSEDVEALVADPSFRDTDTGELLALMAERYDFALRRHDGYVLPVDAVPDDFRGPAMPKLALRLAQHDFLSWGDSGDDFENSLNAVAIDRAAVSLVRSPETWADWGSVPDTPQHLKQLWQVLVRYGMPQVM